jgi:hypothetical protein
MQFQTPAKIITNQSSWHYSLESIAVHLEPSVFSNCCSRSLMEIQTEVITGEAAISVGGCQIGGG